ncbi:MAG: transposase [Myxococcales bacterium]
MPPAPWAAPRELRRRPEGKESEGSPSPNSRATAAEPEKSLLHETVREHLKSFLAEITRMGAGCPASSWPSSSDTWARFLLARDSALITRTLHLALRGIFARQRLRARRLGVRGTKPGAVSFVQLFGSALNLNVHFHCVVPDGVWARKKASSGSCRFPA